MRRKSFSLVLLIFIVISVILVVALAIHLINGPSKKDDKSSKNKTENTTEVAQTGNETQNVLDSNFFDSLNVIDNGTASENTTTPSTSNTEPTSETTGDQSGKSLDLNGHTYKFDSSAEATTQVGSIGRPEFLVTYPDKDYKLLYGTDTSKTFADLKSNSDLQSIIENDYKVTVTSSLKQGNVANLDLIICTISEDNKNAYFLLTPIKGSEVAYAKIYSSEDEQTLINDLSDPLASVSAIISSIQ